MKILYASSEANPFAKSGGLADVAGALPKALVKDGVDCRVVMPLYGDLKMKDKLTYVTNFSVLAQPVLRPVYGPGVRRDLLLFGQRILLQAHGPVRLLR